MVPKPSSNRLNIEKVDFHETSTGVVPERFQGPKMAPKTAQDRLKTGPRSSWIVFFCLFIFRFDFCSFWDRFWCRFGLPNGAPGGRLSYANRPWGGPRRSQDRLGSVLFSSCRSGSLFWSFWGRFGVVFGRSGGRFGAFSAVQLIDSTRQLINSSIQRIKSSTYQLIIPEPFGTFLPGPADCALRD